MRFCDNADVCLEVEMPFLNTVAGQTFLKDSVRSRHDKDKTEYPFH